MNLLSRLLVEPLYRMLYGHPLLDGLPLATVSDSSNSPNTLPGDGSGADGRVPLARETWPCRGLVLIADGVGGFDLCGTGLRYVLSAERLPYAVYVFPWGHGFGRWFADLSDVLNRDEKATLVADAVRQFRQRQPDDPVFLVAKSGGSGVVVKALERLEENSVERAILLAPALSPTYNLGLALRAVRHEMVVFWSPLDVVVLGAGTRLFGTSDRVRGASAGMTGFLAPATKSNGEGSAPDGYEKLRQVKWTPRMAGSGYLGGHLGTDSPAFLRRYVVPLLRAEGEPTMLNRARGSSLPGAGPIS
jgi:pimeloyl-ACP methyl ester carboxylesterase